MKALPAHLFKIIPLALAVTLAGCGGGSGSTSSTSDDSDSGLSDQTSTDTPAETSNEGSVTTTLPDDSDSGSPITQSPQFSVIFTKGDDGYFAYQVNSGAWIEITATSSISLAQSDWLNLTLVCDSGEGTGQLFYQYPADMLFEADTYNSTLYCDYPASDEYRYFSAAIAQDNSRFVEIEFSNFFSSSWAGSSAELETAELDSSITFAALIEDRANDTYYMYEDTALEFNNGDQIVLDLTSDKSFAMTPIELTTEGLSSHNLDWWHQGLDFSISLETDDSSFLIFESSQPEGLYQQNWSKSYPVSEGISFVATRSYTTTITDSSQYSLPTAIDRMTSKSIEFENSTLSINVPDIAAWSEGAQTEALQFLSLSNYDSNFSITIYRFVDSSSDISVIPLPKFSELPGLNINNSQPESFDFISATINFNESGWRGWDSYEDGDVVYSTINVIR